MFKKQTCQYQLFLEDFPYVICLKQEGVVPVMCPSSYYGCFVFNQKEK